MQSSKPAFFSIIALLVVSNLIWAFFYWIKSGDLADKSAYAEEIRWREETMAKYIVARSAEDSIDDVHRLLRQTFPDAVFTDVSDDETDSIKMDDMYFDFSEGRLEYVW